MHINFKIDGFTVKSEKRPEPNGLSTCVQIHKGKKLVIETSFVGSISDTEMVRWALSKIEPIERDLERIWASQVEENGITDFNTMELDDQNLIDLHSSLPDLIGIVHEQEGGIIAYAIGQEHADEIQAALTLYKALKS